MTFSQPPWFTRCGSVTASKPESERSEQNAEFSSGKSLPGCCRCVGQENSGSTGKAGSDALLDFAGSPDFHSGKESPGGAEVTMCLCLAFIGLER